MHTYKCKIQRVVDGDTVDVDIDLGFNTWILKERVRLDGIDAPESRTSDKVEKIFGIAAKTRLEELLPEGKIVTIITALSNEKFGRTLGKLYLDEISVNDLLVSEGHAVIYQGQSKDTIIELHKTNRAKLIAEGKVVM